jgi:hypothetical protein
MVSFQTKNHNLGKIWRALDWKMLSYIMTIWNILLPFGIFLPLWYVKTKKNLATLSPERFWQEKKSLFSKKAIQNFNATFPTAIVHLLIHITYIQLQIMIF